LRNPTDLTDKQPARCAGCAPRAARYRRLHAQGSCAGLFEHGPSIDDVTVLIDRFRNRAARSQPEPTSASARRSANTVRGSSLRYGSGINNARTEALNNKVRQITRRAHGFHSASAALALVLLSCAPITLQPPHELTLTLTLAKLIPREPASRERADASRGL
jgi:transposase